MTSRKPDDILKVDDGVIVSHDSASSSHLFHTSVVFNHFVIKVLLSTRYTNTLTELLVRCPEVHTMKDTQDCSFKNNKSCLGLYNFTCACSQKVKVFDHLPPGFTNETSPWSSDETQLPHWLAAGGRVCDDSWGCYSLLTHEKGKKGAAGLHRYKRGRLRMELSLHTHTPVSHDSWGHRASLHR